MNAAIALKNVTKSFTDRPGQRLEAVARTTLEIGLGEFFVLVGPSGCGKSTLLRMMSGLDREFGGEVRLGEGIRPGDLAFVFQQFALLPWLTVAENVELPLISREPDPKKRRARARGELDRLGLADFAHVRPRELSGGMRQRVGVARALVTGPKIVFMDEPFSELDTFTAQELRREVLAIWEHDRPTVVLVSHNIVEAIELGDRIAVMTPRPGRIERVVENRLARPRVPRSPEFFRMEDELTRLIRP